MINVNPFNITKAVDYSDLEIDKFWVDIPGGGFADIIKPQSSMPIMILGGKGSGKTHIMRYFSFNLQKIRYKENLLDSINKDKYIGVFLRCGGLNSSKFIGASQSMDAWKNIFSYYFELWLSQLVINIVEEILILSRENFKPDETLFCNEVYKLFDKDISNEFNSISGLKEYLKRLQREVDYEVNNCAITGEKISSTRILVSPGKLIFGLPNILKEQFNFFSSCQVIYLIDEYENLLDYQQKYINTLLREREDPVSFRIGARWYGIKTYETFSGNEELKVGSEYDKIIIDQLLRDRKEAYSEFAKKIFLSRLDQAGYLNPSNSDANFKSAKYFEDFKLDVFLGKLRIKKESDNSGFRRIRNTFTQKNVEEIIEILRYRNDALIERTSLMLFYREWKKGSKDLKKYAENIQKDRNSYLENVQNRTNLHFKVLDKFKSDLIDQLHRENLEKLPYVGLDKIIKMSAGIPRLFLITLKHIYRWSIYNGESPFSDKLISEDAQLKGIEDAIKWFLDDARVSGPTGTIANTIDRLGQLMHIIRFSDAPPECSLSSFSINSSDINDEIQKTLDFLEQYSYLIKGPVRREKNTSIKRSTYQINGLLAPHWELPIFTRGILQLNSNEVKAIFGLRDDDEFNKIKASSKSKYYAPFNGTIERNNSNLELF